MCGVRNSYRVFQLCRLLDKASSFKTQLEHAVGISNATHCIRNIDNRTTKANNKSNLEGLEQKLSACEGVIIWAVNRYVKRYQLTDRPLESTYLWAASSIRMRRASHYSIIKILRQLDNSKSPIWLYLFYSHKQGVFGAAMDSGSKNNTYTTRYAKTCSFVTHTKEVNLPLLHTLEKMVKYSLFVTRVKKLNIPWLNASYQQIIVCLVKSMSLICMDFIVCEVKSMG